MKNYLLTIFAVSTLLACDAKPTNTPPPNTDPMFQDHWSDANPDDRGVGTVDPVAAKETEGKVARRLSVDELRRSIPALFDGITWTVPIGRNMQGVGFNALSRTLGEADYIQSTVNNLDPTPLFFKFMDDMAGDVCEKAIARDVMTPSPSDRIIMREADVDSNLRYLRLRLHGLQVANDSLDGIEDLRALYDELLTETGEANDAWFGVCVAMVTSPELIAY
jgi:hypothetical protein